MIRKDHTQNFLRSFSDYFNLLFICILLQLHCIVDYDLHSRLINLTQYNMVKGFENSILHLIEGRK